METVQPTISFHNYIWLLYMHTNQPSSWIGLWILHNQQSVSKLKYDCYEHSSTIKLHWFMDTTNQLLKYDFYMHTNQPSSCTGLQILCNQQSASKVKHDCYRCTLIIHQVAYQHCGLWIMSSKPQNNFNWASRHKNKPLTSLMWKSVSGTHVDFFIFSWPE